MGNPIFPFYTKILAKESRAGSLRQIALPWGLCYNKPSNKTGRKYPRMKMQTINGVLVAVLDAETLRTEQDALDRIGEISYVHQADRVVIPAEALDPAFFQLRSGLAGAILQKFVNYGVRVAIVGDFLGYTSKALQDFIRESNQWKQVYFAATEEEALQKLSD